MYVAAPLKEMIEVNPDKLISEMRKTGKPISHICEMCGYSRSYYWVIQKRGVASADFTQKLFKYFGIPYKKYKPDNEVLPTPLEQASMEQQDTPDIINTLKGIDETMGRMETVMNELIELLKELR